MHDNYYLLALTSIFVLGIGSQWLASRLRLPSILLLLVTGFLAGPVTGFLKPDKLFPDLLFPLVSLSVAIILFEGGMTLHLDEFKEIGWSLTSLLLVGAALTWALTTMTAYWVLGMQWSVALLLGAVLVVTGPTVVGPLLSYIRPVGKVAALAKWEGIVIDPIGAMLAVIVFEAHQVVTDNEIATGAILVIGKTFVVGIALGLVAAWLIVFLLRHYAIADQLHNPVVLMFVLAAFTLSHVLQHESGLVTVTVMGLVLGNQKRVAIKHIAEFKENLTVLLISCLFILLAARLELGSLQGLGWSAVVFVALLMLVVRPASVFLATAVRSGLSTREKIFLSWMAPRGIVAAAVASIFALRLGEEGRLLPPVVFLVIVATVAVYGLTAGPLARRLGLASSNPQGVLIASAHSGARAIAHAIKDAGFPVFVVDSNLSQVVAAKLEGIPATHGNVLSEEAVDVVELGGIGRFMALTSNDEVNSLAAIHFAELFGRREVYQLTPPRKVGSRGEPAGHLIGGRLLFGKEVTYDYLDQRFAEGDVVKRTRLTKEFDYAAFLAHHGEDALPLFLITESGRLIVCTANEPAEPRPGMSVIALVRKGRGNESS